MWLTAMMHDTRVDPAMGLLHDGRVSRSLSEILEVSERKERR